MSVSLFFSKALGMTEAMIELPDIFFVAKKEKAGEDRRELYWLYWLPAATVTDEKFTVASVAR